MEIAENSKTKCVALTIETRPDYCFRPHLTQLLRYNCTRLEIGVQSVYEDVALDTNRGHTVESVSGSFNTTKDTGYKIIIHMMPNLPNVDLNRDIEQFKELFVNPKFRIDGMKIYPTMVIRNTGLYELWKNDRYKSYSVDTLVDLLTIIFSLVLPWIRIYRVQRDIPIPLISDGVEHSNIREMVLNKMKDLKIRCRDIRTREVGIKNVVPVAISLIRRDYSGNNGWETFLSYEDLKSDVLIGLLRLRKCSLDTFRSELVGSCGKDDEYEEEALEDDILEIKSDKQVRNCNASIIRELHVYGTALSLDQKDQSKFQHKGYGAMLINEAERIARNEHLSKKIAIISAVGTRNYYKKFGYLLEGTYMVKNLV